MLKLVNMTSDDIDICSDIYLSAFKGQEFISYKQEIKDKYKSAYMFESYFSQCINENDRFALCLYSDDNIVAFMTGWNEPSLLEDYSLYIDIIAVASEHQRKGYGTEMLNRFFDQFGEISTFSLNTKQGSAEYNFYKKADFYDTEDVRMTRSPIISALVRENERLQKAYEDAETERQKLLKEMSELKS